MNIWSIYPQNMLALTFGLLTTLAVLSACGTSVDPNDARITAIKTDLDQIAPGVWYSYEKIEGGYSERIHIEGRSAWEWALSNLLLQQQSELVSQVAQLNVTSNNYIVAHHRLNKLNRLIILAREVLARDTSLQSQEVSPQSCSPFAYASASSLGAYGNARSCVTTASAMAYAYPGEFNTREWASAPGESILVSASFDDPDNCSGAEGWAEAEEKGSISDFYSCN